MFLTVLSTTPSKVAFRLLKITSKAIDSMQWEMANILTFKKELDRRSLNCISLKFQARSRRVTSDWKLIKSKTRNIMKLFLLLVKFFEKILHLLQLCKNLICTITVLILDYWSSACRKRVHYEHYLEWEFSQSTRPLQLSHSQMRK